MDDSTTAGHLRCSVDTHLQEEMGRLEGGEVAAFHKGQEEEAGGGRAGVQPRAGRRTCEKDDPTAGSR